MNNNIRRGRAAGRHERRTRRGVIKRRKSRKTRKTTRGRTVETIAWMGGRVYTADGCGGGGGYDIKTPLQRVSSTAGRTPTAEFPILTTRENVESFNLRKHALKINGDVASEKRSCPSRFYYDRSRVEGLKRNKINSLASRI